MGRLRAPYAPPITLGSLLLAGLAVCAALPAGAANETPKKRTAYIYGAHKSATNRDNDLKVARVLCSEGYDVTMYVKGRPGGKPLLHNLVAIAQSGFGVLVLRGHGSPTSFTLEEFTDVDSAKARVNLYKADLSLPSALRDGLDWGYVDEEVASNQTETRYVVGVTPQGMKELFGGPDPNRSIMVVVSCHSAAFANTTPAPFGATELITFDGKADPLHDGNRLARAFFKMGGVEGLGKRPVKPAFAAAAEAGFRHRGPGNTTLSPACDDHTPADNTTLPLNIPTPGTTRYETLMKTTGTGANVIMDLEKNECLASITNQLWVDETNHRFQITPTVKGKLVVRVIPTKAVSKNNESWLIGNRYLAGDSDEAERPTIDECDFGLTGLDSNKGCPVPPPEDPFRWCLNCGEATSDPPKAKAPQSMGDESALPRRVPAGETDAFVLYQAAPGPNTGFSSSPAPPNLSFYQAGTWYSHVVFTPDAGQIGQTHAVTFDSQDDNGPREQRIIQWEVVPRIDALSLQEVSQSLPAGNLGLEIVAPGDSMEYAFILRNSGNTDVEQIVLSSAGLAGPALLPVAISPGFVSVLRPGAAIRGTVRLETQPVDPSGLYTGQLELNALTADGPWQGAATLDLRVERAPVIAAPSETLFVVPGVPIAIPISYIDEDGGELIAYTELGPFGGRLENIGPSGATYVWTPPAEAAGYRAAAICASDGWTTSVHHLKFLVSGVTAVPESPRRFQFSMRPTPARSTVEFTTVVDVATTLSIVVHDVSGRVLARPVTGEAVAPGRRTWSWRPAGMPSGTYFVLATVGTLEERRRLVWLEGR